LTESGLQGQRGQHPELPPQVRIDSQLGLSRQRAACMADVRTFATVQFRLGREPDVTMQLPGGAEAERQCGGCQVSCFRLAVSVACMLCLRVLTPPIRFGSQFGLFTNITSNCWVEDTGALC